MRKSLARWRRTSRGRSIPKLASTSSPSDPRSMRSLSLSHARGSARRMKIDQVGEVGVVLTDANEPVLTGGDQIIGYRSLKYAIFKPVSLAKKTLVEQREGWVWQTRRRLLLLDMEWLDLPGGKKGKREPEYEQRAGLGGPIISIEQAEDKEDQDPEDDVARDPPLREIEDPAHRPGRWLAEGKNPPVPFATARPFQRYIAMGGVYECDSPCPPKTSTKASGTCSSRCIARPTGRSTFRPGISTAAASTPS